MEDEKFKISSDISDVISEELNEEELENEEMEEIGHE